MELWRINWLLDLIWEGSYGAVSVSRAYRD